MYWPGSWSSVLAAICAVKVRVLPRHPITVSVLYDVRWVMLVPVVVAILVSAPVCDNPLSNVHDCILVLVSERRSPRCEQSSFTTSLQNPN